MDLSHIPIHWISFPYELPPALAGEKIDLLKGFSQKKSLIIYGNISNLDLGSIIFLTSHKQPKEQVGSQVQEYYPQINECFI